MNQFGLPLEGEVQFADKGRIDDSNQKLLELAKQFESGELQAPPHQRGKDAWSLSRKKEWIQRCAAALAGTKQHPLGTICIYTLKAERGAQEYLNEGLQRISTAAEALNCPSMYDLKPEDIQAILRHTLIHVQHRIYKTHADAVDDFCAVNNGVTLEAWEKHRHILVYAEGWTTRWAEQIDLWHKKIHEALASYTQAVDRRPSNLSRSRADMQLFALAHCGRPKTINKTDELERQVVECFKASNPVIVSKKIADLERLSAEIEKAWWACSQRPGIIMQASLARWCLGVMLLHEAPPFWWQEFLTKLFNETGGAANFGFKNENGKQQSINLTTKMDCFVRVCKVLNVEVPDKQKRERPDATIKRGWQADHIEPFADHGDGPVEPMPARLNAAKNARKPI